MRNNLENFNSYFNSKLNNYKNINITERIKDDKELHKYIESLKENILLQIKNNGTISESFSNIKNFLLFYLKLVLEEYNINNSNKNNDLIELLETFDDYFFTIQRFCEILYSPNEYYSDYDKLYKALEIILNI